jgi:hypothetical protein
MKLEMVKLQLDIQVEHQILMVHQEVVMVLLLMVELNMREKKF